MSTHNLCFRAKIKKNVYPCTPQFYYIDVGCKGVHYTDILHDGWPLPLSNSVVTGRIKRTRCYFCLKGQSVKRQISQIKIFFKYGRVMWSRESKNPKWMYRLHRSLCTAV